MILSLDIATVTGWARRTENGIIFGTRDFSAVNYDYAVFGRRFSWWLEDLIADQGTPSWIVIEKPFFHPRSPMAGVLLHCIVHDAHKVAEAQKIPRAEYSPLEIKKFIIGNAYKVSKEDIIKAVRKLGHNVFDEHQADSVALLLLHEERIKNET